MSADFTPEKEDYKILTPFKMQVLTNFPYIEADFDALTNYQLLCKVVEYLNNVITNENEVTEQVESLYNAYISLQNYVNTYFENLDLQTEVDRKLDEMAEDGTLADMIAEYIKMQGQLVYNSVAEMKAAENIQNGSFLKTYGYYLYNDGGGALYKARAVTNEDVIDDMFIIALHDNTLVAELVLNNDLNVKQVGCYSDGVTDNTTKLRGIIKKLYQKEVQSGWRSIKSIYFPKGNYLVEDTLIDSDLSVGGLQLTIKGESKNNTTITTNATVLFDNQAIFGFALFENIGIIGDNSNTFMNYVGGLPGNAQNLRFNQCLFQQFKTILNTTGGTMTSEVTFFECSINSMGSDEEACDIFILDNSQAVNWRFYATDIESFKGILFDFRKGACIDWYQGSCIPLGTSTIIDCSQSLYDYFGDGNRPVLVMNEVRIEMRDNSCLYNKGNTNSNVYIVFNSCGMGGANIPVTTTSKTIKLGNMGTKLYFNNCSNLLNYSISSNTALSGSTAVCNILKFDDCSFVEPIQNIIDRSDIQYTGDPNGRVCQFIIDDINYLLLPTLKQYVNGFKFKDVILFECVSNLGLQVRGSAVDSVLEKTSYINNYVSKITVRNISRGTYGNEAKFTLNFYDDNNTLIGTVEQLIQSDHITEIEVNKYIGTLKMTSTSDYPNTGAVYDTLIISGERL